MIARGLPVSAIMAALRGLLAECAQLAAASSGDAKGTACGCLESWPQLQAGKLNHGPGCRFVPGDAKGTK